MIQAVKGEKSADQTRKSPLHYFKNTLKMFLKINEM